MSVRIKFCGITRIDDARAAVELGVDALGFVFTRRSRRFVDIAQALALREALPPFTSVVALFMDDEPAWIEQVVARVQPDLLQFHGGESAQLAGSFARPYLKAIAMRGGDAQAVASAHAGAAGFLLDGHAPGDAGGSGQSFDWARAPRLARPVILAGGLDAGNVAQAIAVVRPYAVDVSSGIETSPGIKDAAEMRAFVEAVRAARA
ncbi:MAG: phosphoribosylanthranilate isomerase [Lysobacteraceae bacterium]|jgi:phosphoribosylanthranilate isomerase|nr:MAG: phosphoribosylanthranilate isomerase [Xanthomonadaceae bacterium]